MSPQPRKIMQNFQGKLQPKKAQAAKLSGADWMMAEVTSECASTGFKQSELTKQRQPIPRASGIRVDPLEREGTPQRTILN